VAENDECELKPGEHDAPPEEAQTEFASELDEAYAPEPELCVPAAFDGLPIPAKEGSAMPFAPAYSIDNLVCVEDDREYVEVWLDELMAMLRGRPRELLQIVDGGVCARHRYNPDGSERERAPFKPAEVEDRWGLKVYKKTQPEQRGSWPFRHTVERYVVVRPKRERCTHYCCQVLNNDEQTDPTQPGHRLIFRNCAARRSVGGALMSLRDQAVYSCDYRSPPDERTQRVFAEQESVRLHGDAHEKLIPFMQLKTRET
jgi:hypothetical protein